MKAAHVALLISHKDFQPAEYHSTRTALEAHGIRVITLSNNPGHATATDGTTIPVDNTLEHFHLADCKGFFIIGGPGALEHLDNTLVYKKIKDAETAKLPFGAICISPRILLKAGVMKNVAMTGWDEDPSMPLAPLTKQYGATYLRGHPVVRHEKIITANGPAAAAEFGKTIAQVVLHKI